MGASADCRAHTVNWRDRALAAEKQLATLQQTVDAIVKERDALRGKVQAAREACDDLWVVEYERDDCRHICSTIAAILDDKETP